MALPHRINMTVEEYFALDDRDFNTRYEYIDGHIRMLSGGTPDHAQISANFIGVLYGLLKGKGYRIFSSDVHVRLSDTSYVRPDVSVSCDVRDKRQDKTIAFPCLVVEVLSPSTESYDRKRKLMYYQACSSVQEYVLVNTHFQWIEVFRRGQGNFWLYRAFEYGDEIELTSLDIRFPIEDVYLDVDLLPEPPEEG